MAESHIPIVLFLSFDFISLLPGSSHQIFWTREPRLVCVCVRFLGITPPWTS